MYLKAHQPDLGIDNPYELDEDQFNAAVDLLKQQRPNVGEYWSSATKQIQSFTNGDDQVGTTWQYQYFTLQGRRPAGGVEPGHRGLPARGGRDRVVGHVDDPLAGSASELHVPVDELHLVAEGSERQIAEFFGEAPANQKACGLRPSDPKFCDKYHAADPAFWKRVYYWNTPLADCGDDRGESAWTTTTGSRPGPRSRGSR